MKGTHRQQVLWCHLRTQRDGPDNMRMLKRMQSLAAIRIPHFTAFPIVDLGSASFSSERFEVLHYRRSQTYAEKSALPVAARDVSNEIFDDQTAPL